MFVRLTQSKITSCLLVALTLSVCGWSQPVDAQEAVERIEKVRVAVTNFYGRRIERDITVTIFEVPGRASYPLLVLNHGRDGDDAGRVKMGRVRHSEASRWFATLGYSVWVPTRIGYGVSGTDVDPEYTGTCAQKRYEPGYTAAVDQTLQVIEYAKRRTDIDGNRIVVVGQSFGGMTSIAVASRNAPGLVAAVNFAGGGGANPQFPPGEPCAPELLLNLFGTYGKTARVPTLSIYTENDKLFAPRHTKAWFDAFRANGGAGEYLLQPAFGTNGHSLFALGFTQWRPIVERFLAGVGKGKGE